MTDRELDQRLLASRPTTNRHSTFTRSVMAQLTPATIPIPARTTSATKWSLVMKYLARHKIQAALAGLALVASLGFTGYAYATGTDPVSLIQRIVKDNQIEIKYDGRTFEHGAGRSYSDAAISAYAELNTIWGLHFHASNAFTTPKNGIEHVSPPKVTNFQYPWVGTITSINDATITVTRHRIMGDKARHSAEINDTVTLPRSLVSYYIKGEPSSKLATGRLIEVFQDEYLKHITGTKGLPTPTLHYFVYELTHSLADILEADQTQAPAKNPSQQGLTEPSSGGVSTICLNNGADRCEWTGTRVNDREQSFYFILQYYDTPQNPNEQPVKPVTPRPAPANNPDVIAIGEMLPDDAQVPSLLMRNTEGRVTGISNNTFTLKSSSGATWTLDLKPGVLEQFAAQWGSPLKVGDKVGA